MPAPMMNMWRISKSICGSWRGLALAFFLLLPVATQAQMTSRGGYSFASFHADIVARPDAVLEVKEKLTGEFIEPRHGLFRRIPVQYTKADGKKFTVPLSVQSVMRNGSTEPYKAYREGADMVIKIGDPSTEIDGPFVYEISYEVKRAVIYGASVDEVYWNVTGTDWDVPIPDASATMSFAGIAAKDFAVDCYTGREGSKAQDCVSKKEDGKVTVTATDYLTLSARFPKGFVHLPTSFERCAWWWADSWPSFFWLLPLLAFFGLLRYWWMHGKDAKGRGTIVPEYDTPDGLRPAEAGMVIDTKVYDREVAATLVDFAVRGYMQIIEKEEKTFGLFSKRVYTLQKKKEIGTDMRPYEQTIFSALFASGDKKTMEAVDGNMATAIAAARNWLYQDLVTRGYFSTNPRTAGAVTLGIGIAFGLLGWFLGIAVGSQTGNAAVLISCLLTAVIFICFSPFMKQRTKKGALVLDQVKGFKLFLETAERYRLQWQEREGIFEKFLPYAIAFGVTEKWAKAFEGMNLPAPTWYVGLYPAMAFRPTEFGQSIGSFATMAGAVRAPASSGGGGSGFSGGGFGGGGGGSW